MDEKVAEVLERAGYHEYKHGRKQGFAVDYSGGALVVWPMGEITLDEGEALVRQWQGVLQAAGFKINHLPIDRKKDNTSCLVVIE